MHTQERPASSPVSPSELVEAPELSVVIAVGIQHGLGMECLQSWIESQDCPRQQYQIVLACSGSDPEFEARVQEFLQPQDLLIRVPSAEVIGLFDAGARAAQGRLLLLTENHCKADPA